MAATLLVVAIFSAVYLTLIALHATAIRHHADGGRFDRRPRLAVWLAAHLRPDPRDRVPADPGLARDERLAVRRLLSGDLDKDGYRETLAGIAAQDAAAHPLQLPRSRQ
ncbi:hypothetical protein Drose_23240 [Dactylosporangium roseum]|uniref:SHOCT domain-containing protein n=1 Tax=Dactylosporangium roseum TaxID=47989 RepID=A0ABY5YWN8_9ACTN|nr:hypothetical protein [Dactylosporangium roseum]UWZ34160.1 hypothetical protein Drose_23240 [Dactylosporangium roseum]